MAESKLLIPITRIKMTENRVVLLVHWDRESGELNYQVVELQGKQDLGLTPPYCSPQKVKEEQVRSLQEEMLQSFRDLTDMFENGAGAGDCCKILGSYSEKLTSLLIPEKLIDDLSSRNKLKVIQISSDEYWMPWDLLFCRKKQSFWGCLWNCVRLPVSPSGDNRFPKPYVAEHGLEKILNLVGPDALASAALLDKASRLFDWITVEPSVEAVSNNPTGGQYMNIGDINQHCGENGFDLVHFLCHSGHTTLLGLFLKLGPSVDYWLNYEKIHSLPVNSAIVLSNACSAAKSFFHLREVIAFGWEFNQAGAGAFIGPIADITFEVALDFGKRFFHYLIDENMSASQAFQEARQAFLRDGDVRALFFVFCGYPDARKTVVRAPLLNYGS